ncbi:MAG: hypothetical protein AAGM16_10205 [Pseudomonadota bacterium]
MSSRLVGLAVAAGLGAVVGVWAVSGLKPGPVAQPITQLDEADVSQEAATAMRAERFASVDSIQGVLALPGEFAELEALYALASRSSASEIEALLVQAVGVPDPQRRDDFVRVLLTRLVAMDARRALVAVEGPLRRSGRNYQSFVWQQWARRDFDTALTVAALEDGQRVLRAKALYLSLADLDDPRAAEIESALGIAPDTSVRARNLERVYADGAEAMLAYVDGRTPWSRDEAKVVARLLYAEFEADALSVLDQLGSPVHRETLQRRLIERITEQDPLYIINTLGGQRSNGVTTSDVQRAYSELAKTDPDEALALLDRLPLSDRRGAEMMIISEVARTDAETALQLLDQVQYAPRDQTLNSMILRHAESDIDLALSLVDRIEAPMQQGIALGGLAFGAPLARMPDIAARVLAIDSAGGPTFYRRNLMSGWARRDPGSAIEWVQTLPAEEQAEFMGPIVAHLAKNDPQRAIDMGVASTGPGALRVKQQLAGALAANGSIEAAMSIANAVADPDARFTLQSQALTQLARTNESQALDLARATGNTALIDSVLVSRLNTVVRKDPEAVLARLDEISNPAMRQDVEQNAMRQLAAKDPELMRQRVDAMPPGAARDGALLGLVNAKTTVPADALVLVDEIEDPDVKQQAQFRIVMRVARDDPGEARRMMEEMELPEATRRQLDRIMARGSSPFLR